MRTRRSNRRRDRTGAARVCRQIPEDATRAGIKGARHGVAIVTRRD